MPKVANELQEAVLRWSNTCASRTQRRPYVLWFSIGSDHRRFWTSEASKGLSKSCHRTSSCLETQWFQRPCAQAQLNVIEHHSICFGTCHAVNSEPLPDSSIAMTSSHGELESQLEHGNRGRSMEERRKGHGTGETA